MFTKENAGKASRAANAAKRVKSKWQGDECKVKGCQEPARKRGFCESCYGRYFRRDVLLKRRYGIDLRQYNEMLEQQGGVCAICGSEKPGRSKWYFCVDHDHKTGEVRGLLCSSCNGAIGALGDTAEKLEKVVRYLSREKEIIYGLE